MEENYYGFNLGQVLIGVLRALRQKGVLGEEEILELLWQAKDPMFPWGKQEIKELLKL